MSIPRNNYIFIFIILYFFSWTGGSAFSQENITLKKQFYELWNIYKETRSEKIAKELILLVDPIDKSYDDFEVITEVYNNFAILEKEVFKEKNMQVY